MAMTISLGRETADSTRLSKNRLIFRTIDITSYTIGGESAAPSDFGLSQIDFIGQLSSEFGYHLLWDRVNNTLEVYGQEPEDLTGGVIALAEETAATDAGTFEIIIVGY